MLLKELGYVVETASIFGRTTGDVHAMVNCYAPTIIQTYGTPSLETPGGLASLLDI